MGTASRLASDIVAPLQPTTFLASNAAVFSNAPLAAERPLALKLVAGAVGVLIQPLSFGAAVR